MQRSDANKGQEVAYVFWILSQIWRKKQKGFYARTCCAQKQLCHASFLLGRRPLFKLTIQDSFALRRAARSCFKEGLDALYEKSKVFSYLRQCLHRVSHNQGSIKVVHNGKSHQKRGWGYRSGFQ